MRISQLAYGVMAALYSAGAIAAEPLTSTLLFAGKPDSRLAFHSSECDGDEAVECEIVGFTCDDSGFHLVVTGLSERAVSEWFRRGLVTSTAIAGGKTYSWRATAVEMNELDGDWFATLSPDNMTTAEFLAAVAKSTQVTLRGPSGLIRLPIDKRAQENVYGLAAKCLK